MAKKTKTFRRFISDLIVNNPLSFMLSSWIIANMIGYYLFGGSIFTLMAPIWAILCYRSSLDWKISKWNGSNRAAFIWGGIGFCFGIIGLITFSIISGFFYIPKDRKKLFKV